MRNFRRILTIAAILLFAVAGGLLLNWNSDSVSLHYFPGKELELPIWIHTLMSFGFGALLACLILSTKLLQYKFSLRKQQKHVTRLQDELHQLRNLPIATETFSEAGKILKTSGDSSGSGASV